ncbi:conserved hypothetical protein [Ricinus communis]|uniref:Aminotransferase-like plant mobile domain-containing protein n=1 Tax=Ricinus communis TaxID=3988 RepID=B9SNL0_RICCO|nr:conserved hypothetical protein [Ricinus communis]
MSRLADLNLVLRLACSRAGLEQLYQGLDWGCRDRRTLYGFAYLHIWNDAAAMAMLIERWLDTMHNFQLHFREMTVTPLDYTALIGLHWDSNPPMLDYRFRQSTSGLAELLGFMPTI